MFQTMSYSSLFQGFIITSSLTHNPNCNRMSIIHRCKYTINSSNFFYRIIHHTTKPLKTKFRRLEIYPSYTECKHVLQTTYTFNHTIKIPYNKFKILLSPYNYLISKHFLYNIFIQRFSTIISITKLFNIIF